MTDRDPRPDALPHASTDAPPKHRRPATKPAGKPRNLLLGLSLIIVAALVVLALTSFIVSRFSA